MRKLAIQGIKRHGNLLHNPSRFYVNIRNLQTNYAVNLCPNLFDSFTLDANTLIDNQASNILT